MAANPSASQKNKNTDFVTPKRGNKIKAQIFESMLKAVGIRKSEGSSTSGDENSIPSATPRPSADNSDANPNASPT